MPRLAYVASLYLPGDFPYYPVERFLHFFTDFDMEKNLVNSDSRELRSLFLKESKKFLKILDYDCPEVDSHLRDQMLNEIRQNLKELLNLIELKERQEGTSNN